MSEKPYICKQEVIVPGTKRLDRIFSSVINDHIDQMQRVRDIEDLLYNVNEPSMQTLMFNLDGDDTVINFKIVSNEINNDNCSRLPLILELFYHHKNSDTQAHTKWTFSERPPKPEPVDKFAAWRS